MPPSKKPSEGTLVKVARNTRKRKMKLKNSCEGCSKTFKVLSKMRLHKSQCKMLQGLDPNNKTQKHANTKSFKGFDKMNLLPCKQCPKKFKFEKSLLEHILHEHSEAPASVECEQCPVRCPDEVSMQEHVAAAHNRKLYECPYCKKTFVRLYHVHRHLKQKGCSGDTVKTIECEICNISFKRKDNLLVHLRTHLKPKAYRCKHCTYSSQSYQRYFSHTQKKHMPKHFECHYCGKVNSSRGAIAKHLEIHGEKKFACEVCGYSTHTIEVIRRHVLRHTNDKPYKCELCPASFIQILQLRRHLEKHVGNQCATCQKSFKTKASLAVHERIHLGLKKLHCPHVGCVFGKKAFSTETALEEHSKTHDTKSLLCEVCDKRFHGAMNLKRHMLTHTLDRPRRCMYCVSARAYIRGEALVRHVRTRHPAIFHEHLLHVRQVMGSDYMEGRVKKTETESIINLLDAISDRIIDQNKTGNVLYGGMQDVEDTKADKNIKKEESKPALLSEAELAECLRKLMAQLIDAQTLEVFGWPDETVDVVLEMVLEQCGTKPADRARWSRVQRLRENAKYLFLHVIEDKTTSRMLETHTIDQVVMHILEVSEGQDEESEQEEGGDEEAEEAEGEDAEEEQGKGGDAAEGEESEQEEDSIAQGKAENADRVDNDKEMDEEDGDEMVVDGGEIGGVNLEEEASVEGTILEFDDVEIHGEQVEIEMDEKKVILIDLKDVDDAEEQQCNY